MSNRSKQKGDRGERAIKKRLEEMHPEITAERVPLSGACQGSFSGDLKIDVAGVPFRAEVKTRDGPHGWRNLRRWLGLNDFLILREDKAEPYVFLPWAVFRDLLVRVANAERGPIPIPTLTDLEELYGGEILF